MVTRVGLLVPVFDARHSETLQKYCSCLWMDNKVRRTIILWFSLRIDILDLGISGVLYHAVLASLSRNEDWFKCNWCINWSWGHQSGGVDIPDAKLQNLRPLSFWATPLEVTSRLHFHKTGWQCKVVSECCSCMQYIYQWLINVPTLL